MYEMEDVYDLLSRETSSRMEELRCIVITSLESKLVA